MSANGSKVRPSYNLDLVTSADQLESGPGPLVRGAFPPNDGTRVASSHRLRLVVWFSNTLEVDSGHTSCHRVCNLSHLPCHMGHDMGLHSWSSRAGYHMGYVLSPVLAFDGRLHSGSSHTSHRICFDPGIFVFETSHRYGLPLLGHN